MVLDPAIGATNVIQESLPILPFIKANNGILNFNQSTLDHLERLSSDCGYTKVISAPCHYFFGLIVLCGSGLTTTSNSRLLGSSHRYPPTLLLPNAIYTRPSSRQLSISTIVSILTGLVIIVLFDMILWLHRRISTAPMSEKPFTLQTTLIAMITGIPHFHRTPGGRSVHLYPSFLLSLEALRITGIAHQIPSKEFSLR